VWWLVATLWRIATVRVAALLWKAALVRVATHGRVHHAHLRILLKRLLWLRWLVRVSADFFQQELHKLWSNSRFLDMFFFFFFF
jgi:hypothetical protein